MIVGDGAGPVGAIPGRQLGQILADGDQLDAKAGGCGREGIEVSQWGDVGRFVEHDEQRRVQGGTASLDPLDG
jgi:hypothetical protein